MLREEEVLRQSRYLILCDVEERFRMVKFEKFLGFCILDVNVDFIKSFFYEVERVRSRYCRMRDEQEVKEEKMWVRVQGEGLILNWMKDFLVFIFEGRK